MPEAFDRVLAFYRDAPIGWALAGLLVQNVVVFAAALVGGRALVHALRRRRVCAEAPPITRAEVALAALTVVLNTLVTLAGLMLWRAGIVTITDAGPGRALLDAAVLFVAMDLAMYVLHRAGHIPLFYPLLHRTHHRYERPRPLTLFVLNPAEVLSFGMLWLLLISVYDASWLGLTLYLGANLLFGTVGHLGVEPLPGGWTRIPLLGALTGATFHAQHHGNLRVNFGFYTTIWDRLFGTIAPDYATRLDAAAAGEPPLPFASAPSDPDAEGDATLGGPP